MQGASNVTVLGYPQRAATAYDPRTFDPQSPPPSTPKDAAFDERKYAEWGRHHFGNDWYALRERMLADRNVYSEHDPLYNERQIQLRILEHMADMRPLRPQGGWKMDENWKQLWSRLSNYETFHNSKAASPSVDSDETDERQTAYAQCSPDSSPPDSNEDEKTVTGDNTALLSSHESTFSNSHGQETDNNASQATTAGKPHKPDASAKDPWKKLEDDRRKFNLTDEEYWFKRIFLREDLIDMRRKRREDAPGDAEAREKRAAYGKLPLIDHDNDTIRRRRFNGFNIFVNRYQWKRAQVDAKFDAEIDAGTKPSSEETWNDRIDRSLLVPYSNLEDPRPRPMSLPDLNPLHLPMPESPSADRWGLTPMIPW